MATIASRVCKPSDFSEGLWHEVLVTLGRKGFSPEMAASLDREGPACWNTAHD